MDYMKIAEENLIRLSQNPYPGGGIIVGADVRKNYLVQVYWIMGCRSNSRNLLFISDTYGVLKTEPVDPENVEDPSLIIYTAMNQLNDYFVVSNGHQTTDALRGYLLGLNSALAGRKYEDDPPHFTPRITASMSIHSNNPFKAAISVLKKSPFDFEVDRSFYVLNLGTPGLGYCVTTYNGDGNPLPSFSGVPYLLPLIGDIKEIAGNIWESLSEDNRVSLAVKFINIKNGEVQLEIINKYQKKEKEEKIEK